MKIENSLRNIYAERKPIYELLRSHVDAACGTLKRPRWHYESRVKELESFATKVCSGRFDEPANLEDFLACTFVVPNSASINEAVQLIQSRFTIAYQRPKDITTTHKRAEAFEFDDLRLYCRRGNDGASRPSPIDELVFEIQVKTFLQHAWGIATHDLSYKTEDVRWGKDRIVAHLKAAIEYAEISIQQADSISRGPALQITDQRTADLASLIQLLQSNWNRSDLPENLRGLASTLLNIIYDVNISVSALSKIIEKAKTNASFPPLNVSPYSAILEILLHSEAGKIKTALQDKRKRCKLLILPEINLPADFLEESIKKRVVVIASPNHDANNR